MQAPEPSPGSLQSLVARCLGSLGADAAAIDELAAYRRSLAAALLASGHDASVLEPHVAAVTQILIAGLPNEAGQDDAALIAEIGQKLAQDPPSPNAVMAAMALAPSHFFPLIDLATLPSYLRVPYARYLMANPALFVADGEAGRFAAHRLAAITLLHKAVLEDRAADTHKITQIVTEAAAFMLYFSGANLRPYFRRRAELLERYLKEARLPLRYLPPLTAHKRARMGILHTGLGRSTETYYLLAHLTERAAPAPEIILYLEHEAAGPLLADISAGVDRIVTLPKNVSKAVNLIREDRLDLLLVTRNLTAGGSSSLAIAAHRLAKVQVMGAASPVTSGLGCADMFLSGELNEPAADAQDHYEETLVRLPGSVTCYAYSHDRDPRTLSFSRAALGISETQTVFFSAANCFKIIPEVFRAWASILAGAPDSCLVLMPYNPHWFDTYARALFQRRIARQLGEHGVAAGRVIILDAVPARADLHAAMEIADVYLDSFPFSGACSLVDPLQVGLPVVAMTGTTFRSGVAESILRPSGLGHMACPDIDAYVARACALAGDPALRVRERRIIREATSPQPLCTQTAPFARAFLNFAQEAVAAWNDRARGLRKLPAKRLQARIAALAETLGRERNADYLQFTDLALTTQLLPSYLQTLKADGAELGRVIDVGACVGEASLPFLRAGWPVDMFEPDPECQPRMEDLCKAFPRARHFIAAVTAHPQGPVTFHKRALGLSGIEPSPYAVQENDISVPSLALSAFYRAERPKIDLLKIDAEGLDLEILDSLDLESLTPRVIMLEFGTAFAKHSPAAIQASISRMADAGYGAVAFSNRKLPGFGVSNWACELDRLNFADDPAPASDGAGLGNLMFYRADDTVLLTCLFLLLESYLPARQRRWGVGREEDR